MFLPNAILRMAFFSYTDTQEPEPLVGPTAIMSVGQANTTPWDVFTYSYHAFPNREMRITVSSKIFLFYPDTVLVNVKGEISNLGFF